MLRRAVLVLVVFATAFLLQFLHTKVLVGEQELNAELRPLAGEAGLFEIAFKDVAGNPVDPGETEKAQVEKRLAEGGDEKAAVLVAGIELRSRGKDRSLVVRTGDKTDLGAMRSRIQGRQFRRDNEARPFWHLTQGIDLRGGVEFVCRLHDEDNRTIPADDEIIATLRARLDERGLTEPSVARLSNGDVQVVIPGGTRADAARTRKVLETTGRLEFREVVAEYPNDQFPSLTPGDAKCAFVIKPSGAYGFAPGVYHNRGDIIAPNERTRGEAFTQFLHLKPVALEGKDVGDASETIHQGQPAVSITFTAVGAAKNHEFTSAVKARGDAQQGTGRLAVVFDGIVKSDPRVIEPSQAHCVISGQFTRDQIETLRSALRAGSLAVTPEVLSERVVGATLGVETVTKALWAMGISLVAILAWMAFYYRGLGWLANLCLVGAGLLIFAILSVFNATVTLPGLAGLVLTIGMAVDANILIYERIREELREQNGMKAAVEAGFGRAFWTIFDSNLTTIITAMILYVIGTGPVKGFGLTLAIGITVSMFASLVIGRLLVDWRYRNRTTATMMGFLPELHLPYVKWRWYGYAFSGLTGLIGLFWFTCGHLVSPAGGGFERNFDIDFTGGNMVQVIFTEELSPKDIEEGVEHAWKRDAKAFSLLDPRELRKQAYFPDLTGGAKSRQWVFRGPDLEGSRLESERAGLEEQRGALLREIEKLRSENKAIEARKATEERLKPLAEKIADLARRIADRTEAFKAQLAQAFAGKISPEGSEVLAAAWDGPRLTLRLATLERPAASQLTELGSRLARGEIAAAEARPLPEAAGFELVVTMRAAPQGRAELDPDDLVAKRLLALVGDGPDQGARAALALEAYNQTVNLAAGQKITVARPFPSTEHFSGQVADQMKITALIAVLLSLLAIQLYVAARFEFRFGIGAVIALVHDVLVTVGLVSLVGIKIDLTVIAAILTIIGFSINDTIVVFDRIRENLLKLRKPIAETIDLSIAQTMPRTILTTGTVLGTVVVLFFWGGEAMYAFSATLLIGLVSGTYSSVFVASPLLLTFGGKMDLSEAAKEGEAAAAPAAIPPPAP